MKQGSKLRAVSWLAVVVVVGMSILGGVGVSGLVVPAAAEAVTVANCSNGVVVAADFESWGGSINSVCDPTLPPNAAQALAAAGFNPVGVASYGGLAFICTIAGYPQGEACDTTPPGDAYWSLWYANAGGNSWTYSQYGAENLHPTAGSIEAWAFGGASGGSQPPIPSPDTLRAATSDSSSPTTIATEPAQSSAPPDVTSAPTTSPGVGSSTGTGAPPAVNGSGAGSTGGGLHPAANSGPGEPPDTTTGTTGSESPKRSTNSVTGQSPPTTTPAPGPRERRSSTSPKIVAAAPVTARERAPGSPLPFLLGAVAVAVLAAGGVLVAWRRRRTG